MLFSCQILLPYTLTNTARSRTPPYKYYSCKWSGWTASPPMHWKLYTSSYFFITELQFLSSFDWFEPIATAFKKGQMKLWYKSEFCILNTQLSMIGHCLRTWLTDHWMIQVLESLDQSPCPSCIPGLCRSWVEQPSNGGLMAPWTSHWLERKEKLWKLFKFLYSLIFVR